ncbi:hypothetical protein J4214_01375 [Candidatus Woesearchaeota archaeon]|nr:hypothetical protein [Candidatus Woesearchaeota archaeon]
MDLNNLIKGDYELFYNFNKERLLKLHLDSEALKEILINIDDNSMITGEITSGLKTILHLTKSLSEENMVLSL